MKVYRITQTVYARDLSGNGARLYGGRWNNEGRYALYTTENRSLALLEILVHIPFNLLQAKSYSVIEITVPDNIRILNTEIKDLPDRWNAWVPSPASRAIGDAFLEDRRYLILRIPSAVMPEEFNYMLNPLHEDMDRVSITKEKELYFDDRLL